MTALAASTASLLMPMLTRAATSGYTDPGGEAGTLITMVVLAGVAALGIAALRLPAIRRQMLAAALLTVAGILLWEAQASRAVDTFLLIFALLAVLAAVLAFVRPALGLGLAFLISLIGTLPAIAGVAMSGLVDSGSRQLGAGATALLVAALIVLMLATVSALGGLSKGRAA